MAADNPQQKPVALWLYGSGAPRQTREINALGLPGVAAFDTLDTAMMGLSAAWQREERLRALDPPTGAVTVDVAAKPAAALPPGEVISGPEAFAFLEAYDVTGAPGSLVADAAAAVTAADALGYPVVLKIESPAWLHKTDRGGVVLDLRDGEAVRRAAAELLARFERETPDAELRGLLVQKQVSGVELLCGLKRDPNFGPVVVVGQGGIHTEVFGDVAHALSPLRDDDPEQLLERLRLAPLLRGVRGAPPVDRAALVAVIRALDRIAREHVGVTELDLNPVIASPQGAFAVDARIVTQKM